MTTSLEHFSRHKQERFEKDHWTILKDEEKEIVVKVKNDGIVYSLSFLESETNRFQELEPTLKTSYFTRFSDEDREEDEVSLEFELDGIWMVIMSDMNAYEETLKIEPYLYFPDDNKRDLYNQPLSNSVKKEGRRIYTHFKQVLIEMPCYRLYFTTHQIMFDDEDVLNWL